MLGDSMDQFIGLESGDIASWAGPYDWMFWSKPTDSAHTCVLYTADSATFLMSFSAGTSLNGYRFFPLNGRINNGIKVVALPSGILFLKRMDQIYHR